MYSIRLFAWVTVAHELPFPILIRNCGTLIELFRLGFVCFVTFDSGRLRFDGFRG